MQGYLIEKYNLISEYQLSSTQSQASINQAQRHKPAPAIKKSLLAHA